MAGAVEFIPLFNPPFCKKLLKRFGPEHRALVILGKLIFLPEEMSGKNPVRIQSRRDTPP